MPGFDQGFSKPVPEVGTGLGDTIIQIKQPTTAQITLKNNKGRDIKVKTGEFIYLNEPSELILDNPIGAIYDRTTPVESTPEAHRETICTDSSDIIHKFTVVGTTIKYSKLNNATGLWSTATTLYTGSDSQAGVIPFSLVDPSNVIHLFWSSVDAGTGKHQLKYATYNGTTFSTPTSPSLNTAVYQQEPWCARDSAGSLHLVWTEDVAATGGYRQVRYAKFTGSWSAAISITSVTTGHQALPKIETGINNYLYIFWHGTDTNVDGSHQIRYKTWNGSSWSSVLNVGTIAGYSQMYVSIAADSLGDVHISWTGPSSGFIAQCVKYAKITNNVMGSWINIFPDVNYGQYENVIYVDELNRPHIYWLGLQSAEPSLQRLKYARHDGTAWVNEGFKIIDAATVTYLFKSSGTRKFVQPPVLATRGNATKSFLYGKWGSINSPQLIPAITTATLSSQIKAIAPGTLKSSLGSIKVYSGFITKRDLGV